MLCLSDLRFLEKERVHASVQRVCSASFIKGRVAYVVVALAHLNKMIIFICSELILTRFSNLLCY